MKISRKAAHKMHNFTTGTMGFICIAEEKLRRRLPDISSALAQLERAKTSLRQITDYINAHTVNEFKTADEEDTIK